MKAFVALMCVAAASAQMPLWYGMPAMYNLPVAMKTIKPEEYTKTMEYKTGVPTMWAGHAGIYNSAWAWPYQKMVDMPKVETDYASKGEYRAEAAGGVVHVAKRSADPQMMYNTWSPYTSTWAHPIAYNNWNNAAWNTFNPYVLPIVPQMKMVADDRQKEDTPDYANKGEYVAESAGVVHLAKRDADAQFLTQRIIPTTSVLRPAVRSTLIQRPISTVYQRPISTVYNTGIQRPISTYSSNILGSRILNSNIYSNGLYF